jgi:hypothetical protein
LAEPHIVKARIAMTPAILGRRAFRRKGRKEKYAGHVAGAIAETSFGVIGQELDTLTDAMDG